MYNLVNTNFSRTYNPIGNRNALSDIKRLLTSRDTVGQTKACGYVVEVVKRYHVNSEERAHMIYYLLENDIVVFLCEATSNLSFPLFRFVVFTCSTYILQKDLNKCTYIIEVYIFKTLPLVGRKRELNHKVDTSAF